MHANATINLSALTHNLSRVRQLAPQSKVMSVIKANAYGHGVLQVADALGDSDAFAVANLEEAVLLRDAGIDKDIVVLQGVNMADECVRASSSGLQLVVHSEEQVHLLETTNVDTALTVWLKIDTGMHRLGFDPAVAENVFLRLQQTSSVAEVRLMSHLANADDRQDPLTQKQIKCFSQAIAGSDTPRSLANSAGICNDLECQFDWVRPGIMLYGSSPFNTGTAADQQLQTVMTLRSNLLAVVQHRKGEAIGYSGSWVCPVDMPVGVVAIGYGDGYPRSAESGTPVLVNGQRVPLVGRVSMDMICIDLRECADARPGDEVVLWGDGLPVEEIARHAETISYELTCRLTSRVKFKYI